MSTSCTIKHLNERRLSGIKQWQLPTIKSVSEVSKQLQGCKLTHRNAASVVIKRLAWACQEKIAPGSQQSSCPSSQRMTDNLQMVAGAFNHGLLQPVLCLLQNPSCSSQHAKMAVP